MTSQTDSKAPDAGQAQAQPASSPKPEANPDEVPAKVREFGGPKGLEPTRYGDWEKQGRCIDF